MLLSPDQQRAFWNLWPQYCRKMGWDKAHGLNSRAIEIKRKEFLAGCGFQSLTQVDRVDGFTRVKHELIAVINDSVQAARETAEPEFNQARVLRHGIREGLLVCIGLYHPDPEGYLTAVMEDKARWWKLDRPTRGITLEDLDARPIVRRVGQELRESPSQLDQIRMTLQARLNEMRRTAGDSIHDMRMKAKLPCSCAKCTRIRLAVELGEAVSQEPQEVPMENVPF